MKHETTITVDDLDGCPDATPIRFGIDGRQYEIDLSADNYVRLAEALAPYIAVSRKIRRSRR